MSPREKRLLGLFLLAGFLLLNFLGFNYYMTKNQELNNTADTAQRELMTARLIQQSRQQVIKEMEWLEKNEPEPMASQDAMTKLVEFAEARARVSGLTVLKRDPLPSAEPEGNHYHRARVEMKVTGPEMSLYRWFDALNVPSEFRITTKILITPNPKVDTQIDCEATIEQWFVPLPPTT